MHQQSLKRQRLAYLCDNLISAVVATLLGVMIVGWVFREIIDPLTLYGWVISALLITAVRLWSYFWIKQQLDNPESFSAIEKVLIATAAATGLAWGIGSMLFAMSTDMFYWVFLAFVLSGYASGSVFTTSASLPACAAYFFPTILPITGWFFLQDDPRAPLMGVLLLVFIAAAWNVARNANRMLLDKYALFAEKAALSDSLEQRNQQLHHEVEEHQCTEARLLQSSERYRQLIERAPVGITVVRNGALVFSNAYWRALIPEKRGEEHIAIEQLVCPEDRSQLHELLVAARENADAADSNQSAALLKPVGWLRDNLPKLHTEVSALSIEFDGQPATLLLVDDIEARLKAEAADHLKYESEAYAQRLAALQTMAGGIAHDFNNLLTAIIVNASLALKKHGDHNPELMRLIKRIEHASTQAAQLSHQMLAYSGHGAFVVEPMNLSSLIADMHTQLAALCSDNTSIRSHLADHIPPIDADPGQIRQMLENLVTNASEAYHDKPGEVTLSIEKVFISEAEGVAHEHIRERNGAFKSGTYISLHVTDSGCGMDEETIQNIFDPFFTTKFTGRGLGMSAVFGIVRALNGDIRIDSHINVGTDVHILLPVSRQSRVSTVNGDAEETSTASTHGKKTVLFVDDEAILREAGGSMLEAIGYNIITACDGLEALEVYRQQASQIAFVILDVTMPGMGGKACLKELHNINPDVLVILSSGYSMDTISSQLGDCAPAAMLQKPYGAKALKETILKLG